MDRRERINDPVEEQRAALDGKQAEMHTAMPGIVQSFDPDAITVTVQPAIRAKLEGTDGLLTPANLPLLVDVPVVFPGGGGFTLTFPVTAGDECLIVFGERCIDAWWANGGVQDALEIRMHDLSDAFAFVGVRSQPRKLNPVVDAANVQLRTDDGEAHVTIMPDYTICSQNPNCTMTQKPDGEIDARNAACSATMTPGGEITLKASATITLNAPLISLQGAISATNVDGSSDTTATFRGTWNHIGQANHEGNTNQTGSHTSSGDQVAGGISQMKHTHPGCQGGSTGEPE